MRLSSFLSYFLSGVLLTNSVPHFVIAFTGRRNLTPFGQNSSALLNLLWALANCLGGSLLIAQTDRKTGAQMDDKSWLLPFEAGCLLWSAFGVCYSFFIHNQALGAESTS